jgi:hypothetical protein
MHTRRLSLALLLALPIGSMRAQQTTAAGSAALARLLGEAYAHELQGSLTLRMAHGLPIETLPDASRRWWEEEARFWGQVRARTDAVSDAGLTQEER